MQSCDRSAIQPLTNNGVMETLEDRRLLSTSLSAQGVLTITETDGTPQTINIGLSGANLSVTVNTTLVLSSPVSSVSRIVVTTGDGDDVISMVGAATTLAIP